jgi:RHS repeat-associated protein
MCSRFGQAYAYSAYGETVPLGPDSGNSLQYTGRENDGTGLYYYRARYYGAVLKRFISEDPVGIEAGPNSYAFVEDDPISLVDPDGLNPFDPLFGLVYQATGGAQAPQWLVNGAAGFGAGVSLGLTNVINNQLGYANQVNQCSTAYQVGSWASFALGGGRLAYAGLAKGISITASSGAAASAARAQLRVLFGGGKSLRPPNLAQYTNDPALRAAAGRTNPYVNAYGAGVAISGAIGGSGCGCP